MSDYTMTDDSCTCDNGQPFTNVNWCEGCSVYHHGIGCSAVPAPTVIRVLEDNYCTFCGGFHNDLTYPSWLPPVDITTRHTDARLQFERERRERQERERGFYCDECGDYYQDAHYHEDEEPDERYCGRCDEYYQSDHYHFSARSVQESEREERIVEASVRKVNSVVVDPLPEEITRDHTNCQCETCKMGRFETSKLKSAVIESYSYEPDWELYNVYADKDKYYLGVELETDNFTSRGKESDISNEIAADMRLPEDFWVPKEDSSISGPEFVSHPATLAYWRTLQPELEEMFMMLLHAGYRSHDNDNCGMHVNISRTAFDGTDHLYRFLSLIHLDPAWSIRMSQRSRNSANNWAHLRDAKKTKVRDITTRMVFGQRYQDYVELNNHNALNFPDGADGKRFEFRLPRGTLRIDRFYKNLEWTHAMIEYTRNCRLLNSRPGAFMAWVEANEVEYPYLAAYIVEKFMNKKERAA